MKKIVATTLFATSLALSACTSTGMGTTTSSDNNIGKATTLGMNIFKASVDAQCRSELEKQQAWRVARAAMSAEQEEAAKTKVCGCVSEQAPQHVTVMDLTNAAVDPSYRQKLVVNVVAKSLQSCYTTLTSGS